MSHAHRDLVLGKLAVGQLDGAVWQVGTTFPVGPSFGGYRFRAEIISQAVWLYFTLNVPCTLLLRRR
jgi:hypothetical protein